MPRIPSEIIRSHTQELAVSPVAHCTLLQPIVVCFEFVADYVDEKSYWVTNSEMVDDCYGTGYTEDEALADLFEAYAENLEWYETEATDRNEMMQAEYERLCAFVRVEKPRKR